MKKSENAQMLVTMRKNEKKQTAKVGVAGSFINQMMANNESIPEWGKGATQLHYTDRTCYEVVEVSEDGKTARLQYLEAEWDKTKSGDIGHQNWILKPTDRYVTVTWRQNAWRTVSSEVVFTEEFLADCKEKGINFIGLWMQKNNPELLEKIYGGHVMPINVVEGYTKRKMSYDRINIIFGVRDYYYDWSF